MGRLSEKEKELVALGAALGSNCVPCIVYHVGAAKKAGITDEEITEAVELADRLRRIPAELVLRTAYAHIGKTPQPSPGRCKPNTPGCGC